MNDPLKAVVASLQSTPTTSMQVRSVLPEILEKIQQGVSHEVIVESLKGAGIEISLSAFRSILYRYRRKNQEAESAQAQPKPSVEADGHPSTVSPVRSTVVEQCEAKPQGSSPLAMPKLSFEDALDRHKRQAIGEYYASKRPPIFGKKKE